MDELFTFLAPIFVALLSLYFILYVRSKYKKPKPKVKNQVENNESNSHIKLLDLENDILLRLEQKSREISSLIDNKISLLNVLVEEADKRLMELEKPVVKSVVIETTEKASMEIPKNLDIRSKVKQLNEAGMSNTEIAKHLKMLEGEVKLILSISR